MNYTDLVEMFEKYKEKEDMFKLFAKLEKELNIKFPKGGFDLKEVLIENGHHELVIEIDKALKSK